MMNWAKEVMSEVSYLQLVGEVWRNKQTWMTIVKASLLMALITITFGLFALLGQEFLNEYIEVGLGVIHIAASLIIGLFISGHIATLLHDRKNATNDHRTLSVASKVWVGCKALFASLITVLVFFIPFTLLSLVLMALSIILIGIVPLFFLWVFVMVFFCVLLVQYAQDYQLKEGLSWLKAIGSMRKKLGATMVFGMVWFVINFLILSFLSLVFLSPLFFAQFSGYVHASIVLQGIHSFLTLAVGAVLWLAGAYGVVDLTS